MLFVCATLIAGCSTSPTSGRPQFNILPGQLETTVPDLRFGVKTMLAGGSMEDCKEAEKTEDSCPPQAQAEMLSRRISPIADRLGAAIPQLAPELVTRVPMIEVFIVPNDNVSVSSSAGGKIAVGSGLARLQLSDTDLALALSRESASARSVSESCRRARPEPTAIFPPALELTETLSLGTMNTSIMGTLVTNSGASWGIAAPRRSAMGLILRDNISACA